MTGDLLHERMLTAFLFLLLMLLMLTSLTSCKPSDPAAEALTEETLFTCRFLLIGSDQGACREDIVGPGMLEIRFNPDPPQTSWGAGIRGLVQLAEVCEFHGSFAQTRLSALQGRGEASIVCPVNTGVDRAYHEIQIRSIDPAPNSSISVGIRMVRTSP